MTDTNRPDAAPEGLAELRPLREKYFAILQQQVILPLKRELADRHSQLQSLKSTDPQGRDTADADVEKIANAMTVLDETAARVESISLTELQDLTRR